MTVGIKVDLNDPNKTVILEGVALGELLRHDIEMSGFNRAHSIALNCRLTMAEIDNLFNGIERRETHLVVRGESVTGWLTNILYYHGELRLDFQEVNYQPTHINCRSVIKPLVEEETAMKTENIASMMIENLKTISVEFNNSSKRYTYKTVDDFEVGDFVVVKARGELKVVEVVEVHKVPQIDVESNIKYQWIIQKVDTTSYDEMNSREEKFADHLLEIQQKAVRANATKMLAEELGVEEADLLEASELLKLENNDG